METAAGARCGGLGSDDFDAQAERIERDHFAGPGDAAHDLADQAAQRRGFVAFAQLHRFAKKVAELIGGEAARHEPRARRLPLRLLDLRVGLVLVANVADDLLQKILDGDEAGDGSIFVDDDAHVLLFALHLAQELVTALGFRNECGGAQDGGDGAGAGLLVGDLQKVVGEGEALDVVERAGVNGDTRVVVQAQQLEKRSRVTDSETAKISGRGVITSRTSMSPNSTAERTSSRSLCSRMPSSSPASMRASTSAVGSSSGPAGASANAAMEKKNRIKTVTGVTSQSSRRMGQSRRAAHRPRVRLKSRSGMSWYAKTTTSTTARMACAISSEVVKKPLNL